MSARIPTTVFPNYDAWAAAGRPVGGVIPVPPSDRTHEHDGKSSFPDRYKDVPAYYIALPTGQLWCPWGKAFNKEQGYHGDGWNVSGPPESLTATPSIQVDGWHGFLTNGELHE